jgi:hypothetical protein
MFKSIPGCCFLKSERIEAQQPDRRSGGRKSPTLVLYSDEAGKSRYQQPDTDVWKESAELPVRPAGARDPAPASQTAEDPIMIVSCSKLFPLKIHWHIGCPVRIRPYYIEMDKNI